jgi:hypothetical protein
MPKIEDNIPSSSIFFFLLENRVDLEEGKWPPLRQRSHIRDRTAWFCLPTEI